MPIWVGGDTEPAFKRTVKYGDAFHAAFQPLADVKEGWARIQQLATEAGRDPAEITLSIRLYHDPESRMAPAKSIAGSTQQMVDSVAQWAQIGVTHILVDPVVPGGTEGRIEAMEQLMSQVAPQVG